MPGKDSGIFLATGYCLAPPFNYNADFIGNLFH